MVVVWKPATFTASFQTPSPVPCTLCIFSEALYIFQSSVYFSDLEWNSHLVSIDNIWYNFLYRSSASGRVTHFLTKMPLFQKRPIIATQPCTTADQRIISRNASTLFVKISSNILPCLASFGIFSNVMILMARMRSGCTFRQIYMRWLAMHPGNSQSNYTPGVPAPVAKVPPPAK